MILQEDSDFLEHFGVKGMRWGVINEVKPTGTNIEKAKAKAAKREEKAAKHDLKAKSIQNEINLLDNTPGNPNSYYSKTYQRQLLTEQKKASEKAAQDIRDGKLTDHQKSVLKGAAAVTGVLAAYGAYNLVQSGTANQLIMKGSAFVTGKPILKKNDSLSKSMSEEDIMKNVVKQINPDFGKPGTTVNCRRCTFAYEMRRRGYDVTATKTTNSHGQNVGGIFNALNPDKEKVKTGKYGVMSELIKESFNKNKDSSAETPITDMIKKRHNSFRGPVGTKDIFDTNNPFAELAKQPNGARGEIALTWKIGGGHSIAYEVIDGRTVMFDTQSGKKFKSNKDLDRAYGKLGILDMGYTRLDNVRLDEDFLLRWVKNV